MSMVSITARICKVQPVSSADDAPPACPACMSKDTFWYVEGGERELVCLDCVAYEPAEPPEDGE